MHNCHLQVIIEDRGKMRTYATYDIPTQGDINEIPQQHALTLRWAEDAPSSPKQYRELLDDMRTTKTEYLTICNALKTAPEPDLPCNQRTIARMQRQSARRLVTNVYNLCYEHNQWAKEHYEIKLYARRNSSKPMTRNELYILYNRKDRTI